MLNDRELIEHWHLREVVLWLTGGVAVCLVFALAFATCALVWRDARPLFWILAAADVSAALILGWKLNRVWKRLQLLQDLMP